MCGLPTGHLWAPTCEKLGVCSGLGAHVLFFFLPCLLFFLIAERETLALCSFSWPDPGAGMESPISLQAGWGSQGGPARAAFRSRSVSEGFVRQGENGLFPRLCASALGLFEVTVCFSSLVQQRLSLPEKECSGPAATAAAFSGRGLGTGRGGEPGWGPRGKGLSCLAKAQRRRRHTPCLDMQAWPSCPAVPGLLEAGAEPRSWVPCKPSPWTGEGKMRWY